MQTGNVKRCAKASTFSSFVKEQGRQLGRSGSPTVSPGTGCPKGRWTAVPEDSGCPEGPGAGRLRAGAGSPSLGGEGGRWSSAEARARQAGPRAGCHRVGVWRGVCVLGRLLFISLLFANSRGGSFRLFPLAQLGRDTAGRCCPASWGAGRARERGQGLVYRSAR